MRWRTNERVSRRAFLGLAAGGLTTAVVGGCSSKSRSASTTSSTTSRVAPTKGASSSSSSPVSSPSLSTLSRQLSGPLLQPTSAGYATAARLYNPRFDATAHPAAIALCTSPADVAACVRFSAAGGAPLRLRSGGHSYGGWSSGEGLVADVTRMSAVDVDAAGGSVRIGAGARLADVYAALGARGVAIAAGSCPTVGITGLTLGGGVGVLTRAFGLTCDAVRSVQIVTADGRVREVDARTDDDLFWALRGGGGGSFGAVTALTMAVQPAPTVQTFFLEWDFGQAESVVAAWQQWMPGTDRRLWSTCKLLADPTRGALHARVAGTWIGPGSDLQTQLSPLRSQIGVPSTARTRSLNYAQAMLFEAGCSNQTADACVADALGPAKRQPFAATSAILSSTLAARGDRHRGARVSGPDSSCATWWRAGCPSTCWAARSQPSLPLTPRSFTAGHWRRCSTPRPGPRCPPEPNR